MKQASLKLNLNVKKTRKQVFLEQMEQVVPWAALVELIAPHYPEGKTGRPPFSLQTMVRVHFMQQWFTLSDPAMEEAFFDTPLYREFAQLEEFGRLPDESTILRFRHRLEKHKLAEQILGVVNDILIQRGLLLKTGTVVDATIIGAPSSTKNADKARDPEMHQTRKGQQWYFGMKLHIGVDSQSGLAHSAVVTSANVHDKHLLPDLLHGNEVRVYGDSAYASQEDLIESKAPNAREFTNQRTRRGGVVDEVQRAKNRNKSRIRSRVEHVFGVVKRLWGFGKVRYRGLQKNATRAFTALALANIYLGRTRLMAQVRP